MESYVDREIQKKIVRNSIFCFKVMTKKYECGISGVKAPKDNERFKLYLALSYFCENILII